MEGVNYLNILNFEQMINQTIFRRGRESYYQGSVSKVTYNPLNNLFNATVEGSSTYRVLTKIVNGKIESSSCTCPYDGICKHIAAVLLEIKNNEILFDNAYGKVEEKKLVDILDELYNKTISFNSVERTKEDQRGYASNYSFTYTQLINSNYSIADIVKHFNRLNILIDISILEVYMTYIVNSINRHLGWLMNVLNKLPSDTVVDKFYEILFLNYDVLDDENLFIDKFLVNLINTIEDNNRFDLLFDLKERQMKILHSYVKNNPQKSKIIRFLFITLEDPTIQKFILLGTLIDAKTIEEFVNKLNFSNYSLSLALYLKSTFEIPINFGKVDLTLRQLNENLEDIKNNYLEDFTEYLVNEINKNYFNLKVPSNELFGVFRELNPNFNYNENDLLKSLAIINNLVDDNNSVIIFKEGLPRKYLKALWQYQSYYYSEKFNYNILVTLGLEDVIDHITIYNDSNDILLDFNVILKDNSIELLNYNNYQEALAILSSLNDAVLSDKSFINYDIVYEKVKKVRKQSRIKEITAISSLLVDELSKELMQDFEIILENKVELIPILSLENLSRINDSIIEYDGDFTVGTKIGIDQMYFVKKVDTLFEYISNKTFQRYGKRLAFDHNINSFSNSAKEILSVLEKFTNFDQYKNNYGVTLSSDKLRDLLNLLKGKEIVLYNAYTNSDYQNYRIDKNNYVVKVIFSEDNLNINLLEQLKNKRINLVKTKSFDFLVNLDNLNIAIVEYQSSRQKKFIEFVLKNEDFDSTVVMDLMINKVLPLIKDDIEIDSSIEAKIKEEMLQIDSYFDYNENKDIITLNSKYFKNNVEVEVLDIKDIHELDLSNYINTLENYGFKKGIMKNQNDILRFFNADVTHIKKLGNVYVSEILKSKSVKKISKVKVNVSIENNLIKAHIDSADLSSEDLSKVLDAYKQGKKYIILDNNVIMTDDESIKDLIKFMELNELDFNGLSEGYVKPIYEIFKFDNNSDNIDFIMEDKVMSIIDDIINFKEYKVDNPPHMYDILKPYQKDGFKWLKTLSKHGLGGILADDMGLGKTLQVISYLESEDFEYSIVICPKSLIYNWSNELNKFGATFEHFIYSGNKEERMSIFDDIKNSNKKSLIITSYDTLRNDLDDFLTINFDSVILDEAQNIKTVNALRTLAVKELRSKKRFVLTGTPIENSIFDLWSIFDFFMPGYLYNYNKFNKIASEVHNDEKDTMDFLIKKIKPFILRRVKKDVLKQLPEKQEEIIYATFDGENKKVYDAYLKGVQDKITNPNMNGIEILSDLMRLRQICISPKLVYDNYIDEQLKVEAATNLIENAISSGHKVLVFSSFVGALDLVKENFKEDESFMLTGKTKAEDRVKMANEFNEVNSKEKIFFISLKAGGTGLNLVGADIVIHLDPWWNVAAENQATDRAHRIGQENVVTVYKIVMKGTIEERIIELQNKKRDLFDKMIESNEEKTKLTMDDYKFILS